MGVDYKSGMQIGRSGNMRKQLRARNALAFECWRRFHWNRRGYDARVNGTTVVEAIVVGRSRGLCPAARQTNRSRMTIIHTACLGGTKG